MVQPHFIDILLGGKAGIARELLDKPACTRPVASRQLFDGQILIVIPVDEFQDILHLCIIAVSIPACLFPCFARKQPDQFLAFEVGDLKIPRLLHDKLPDDTLEQGGDVGSHAGIYDLPV